MGLDFFVWLNFGFGYFIGLVFFFFFLIWSKIHSAFPREG